MSRVLIFGGRDFVPEEKHYQWLDELVPEHCVIISGAARGADQFGEDWASCYAIPVKLFPALWDVDGKAAGPIRNQRMLDSGIDLALQFPGGAGTADMRRRLNKAGVKVYAYEDGVDRTADDS